MLELNMWVGTGRLTRDPEVTTLQGGAVIAKFTIACNRRWKSQSGEKQEEVSFVDCEAWAKTAEFVAKHFRKGDAIFIRGELRQQNWQDKETGGKRSKLSINVGEVKFAESKRDSESAASDGTPAQEPAKPTKTAASGLPPAEAPGDDLPF